MLLYKGESKAGFRIDGGGLARYIYYIRKLLPLGCRPLVCVCREWRALETQDKRVVVFTDRRNAGSELRLSKSFDVSPLTHLHVGELLSSERERE